MIGALRAVGIRRLLKDATGPAPWYLRAAGAGLASARGRLAWRDEVHDGNPTGRMALVDREGRTLLVVPMYARVEPLFGSHFVAWRQRGAGEAGSRHDSPIVDLEVHDADALEPLLAPENGDGAAPNAGTRPVISTTRPVATLAIRLEPVAGTRRLAMPEILRAREEILLIADAQPSAAAGLAICILVLRPHAGEYDILPQDWFNQGNFDFGYQWITRVARDPKSKRIVGDGIRIAPFRLDASGRKLER